MRQAQQSPEDFDRELNVAMYQAAEDTFKRIGYYPTDLCKKEQIEVAMAFATIINHPDYNKKEN